MTIPAKDQMKPGAKYFKGRVMRGARVLHYVVWNGVKNRYYGANATGLRVGRTGASPR
jgi:hypothetical protein